MGVRRSETMTTFCSCMTANIPHSMSIPAAQLEQESGSSRAPLRFISAASLFDGHDAAIYMIRRLLQAQGAEVVHLGHNRSVADIVRAAIQEDADSIAVSSYQGGHNEYFAYMVDMLREQGCEHIRVVVGGGGTIAPQEIEMLERHGVEKIYTPEDGRRMGLVGMIADVIKRVRSVSKPNYEFGPINAREHAHIARTISMLEGAEGSEPHADQIRRALARSRNKVPVIGITGTGGAGKSSLTDELLSRFVRQFPGRQIAVVAMDPTRRRSGGALLGDRIRMNSLASDQIFMRSLATRRQHLATSAVLREVIDLYKLAGFDLIIVETAGIGQSDTEIVDLCDLSLYVMTAEYGAASQLEKIDMLDFADFIVLNKAEKRGAADSLRDPRIPGSRIRYLAEIAQAGRATHGRIDAQAMAASRANGLYETLKSLHDPALPTALDRFSESSLTEQTADVTRRELRAAYNRALDEIGAAGIGELKAWPARVSAATEPTYSYKVRDREVTGENYTESLSKLPLPKIAVPKFRDWGEILRFVLSENLPGNYPYTGGVYPYRREAEDPTRMFAGEGPPERTNRRFHYLAADHGVARLSTAF